MQVIPAIDLIRGRCVRLVQGDFDEQTVYSDDPESVARRWALSGAERLHVVDLEGARTGVPVNMETVRRIAAAVDLPVQLGGGIRTAEAARLALEAGIDRVMVGTAAIERAMVAEIIGAVGAERLLVSVDARDGEAMVSGWTEPGGVATGDLVARVRDLGVARIMYTDISRDGTLTEPNFQAVGDIVAQAGVPVIAAGGIASTGHLVRLAGLGVEGAVVGRALYTGHVDLEVAIAQARSASHPSETG